MNTPAGYSDTADELTRRIVALIPENPHILEMDSPGGLFKVEGFNCEDLRPSLGQASLALSAAKRIHRDTH